MRGWIAGSAGIKTVSAEQGERGAVEEREDLAHDRVDHDPRQARPIEARRDHGAQHRRQVHAGVTCQLRGHEDPREHGRGDKSERRPPLPIHKGVTPG